jgi:hypothetical protein
MRDPEIVTEFRKSSASQGGQQECVEVAITADGGRAVRDSKARGHGTQFHSQSGWATFIANIKSGELDAC